MYIIYNEESLNIVPRQAIQWRPSVIYTLTLVLHGYYTTTILRVFVFLATKYKNISSSSSHIACVPVTRDTRKTVDRVSHLALKSSVNILKQHLLLAELRRKTKYFIYFFLNKSSWYIYYLYRLCAV